MVSALNCDHAFGRGDLLEPREGDVVRGKFIMSAMNEEFGFMAILQGVSIKGTGGYAEANHSLDAVIAGSDAQTNVGAEGESRDYNGQASIAAAQKFQSVAHIVHFATPF